MTMTGDFRRGRRPLALLLLALPLLAQAQTIYKCTDERGGTLISNARVDKSCKAIVSSPENSMPAPRGRAKAVATPSPADFPRVQEETQKTRDGDRRHILEQEAANEQRSLEQARRDLVEQEAQRGGNMAERTAPYRDRIALHERNIQALQKELGSFR
ncbi:MAG: DUF4124 domain-containing protein [Dechloromonas sp.]|nr:DUF4124 domain-containing protein [Dechloromonas sp.]